VNSVGRKPRFDTASVKLSRWALPYEGQLTLSLRKFGFRLRRADCVEEVGVQMGRDSDEARLVEVGSAVRCAALDGTVISGRSLPARVLLNVVASGRGSHIYGLLVRLMWPLALM
jgi:hypothetical protein